MKKTLTGKVTCCVLLLSLAILQLSHVIHFMYNIDLLSHRSYVLILAIIPVAFYFFSRELLFHGETPGIKDLSHGVLLIFALTLPLILAATISFIAGCGYTYYIFRRVIKLRKQIPRYQFEKFFFALFFMMNVLALLLGLIAPWLHEDLFYHGYSASISIAMILISLAILIFPELLSDVLLASETVYAKSKLDNINIDETKLKLEQLMKEAKIYENENLTLSVVAEQLEITAQQLSELVNSCFGVSFPKFVREYRVEAAKKMLIREPTASILSIGLATGFKSQSSFYTAFKDHTGQTPAGFRKTP